jgi:diamine oxidase
VRCRSMASSSVTASTPLEIDSSKVCRCNRWRVRHRDASLFKSRSRAFTQSRDHTKARSCWCGTCLLWVFAAIGLVVTVAIAIAFGVLGMEWNNLRQRFQADIDSSRIACPVELPDAKQVAGSAQAQMIDARSGRVAEMFDMLSTDELAAVRAYLDTTLSLTPISEVTQSSSNYVWAIELLPPPKAAAQAYASGTSTARPAREARAIVFRGADSTPTVVEYAVGPLPNPTAATPIPQPTIPWSMRPVDSFEYGLMELAVAPAMEELHNLLQDAYGLTYNDLYWTDSAPRGYTRNLRQSWIWFVVYVDGMFLQPIGLNMLIDHGINTTSGSVNYTPQILQIVFNGQGPFNSTASLNAAYFYNNSFVKTPYDSTVSQSGWSSMSRRGEVRPRDNLRPPRITYPDGRRWTQTGGAMRQNDASVGGGSVAWMGWQFHVSGTIQGGMVIRDVRYKGTLIAWEISHQDSYARYSGIQPINGGSQYNDAGWGQGWSAFPMMRGLDCPNGATYIDLPFLVDGQDPFTIQDAICVYEAPATAAAMRHYDRGWIDGGTNFAAAYSGVELRVATTATVYNYDYSIFVRFGLDASVSADVQASGYLQADWYLTSGVESAYTTRIHNYTVGVLHDHMFNWKIDVDLITQNNHLHRMDVQVVNVSVPWGSNVPGSLVTMTRANRRMISTESFGESSLNVDFSHPSMFHFTPSGNPLNKWGVKRSYKLDINTGIQQLMPNSMPWMPSNEWTKYNAIVTVRHDNEDRSGHPLYDMQAPSQPIAHFDSYTNGESLQNSDLVAWVTTGVIHMPHSEDAPVTMSTGAGTGWRLRPYNFFDEAPITDLWNHAVVGPSLPGAPSNIIEAQGFESPGKECFGVEHAFAYPGG